MNAFDENGRVRDHIEWCRSRLALAQRALEALDAGMRTYEGSGGPMRETTEEDREKFREDIAELSKVIALAEGKQG